MNDPTTTSSPSRSLARSALAAAALVASPLPWGCSAFSNPSNDAGEEDAGTGSGTGVGGDVTIYEIQRGEVPTDTVVSIEGAVVTTPFQQEAGGVFIEDPNGGEFSGIYVYFLGTAASGVNLQPGDVVDVTGLYSEFMEVSEITVQQGSDVIITGSTNVPDAVVVNPSDVINGGPLAENYEGVLIRVEDVEVTDADPGFGEFVVTGGLHADDFFWSSPPQMTMGESLDAVVGPLHYAFESFKILPRGPEDLVGWAGDGDGDTTAGTGGGTPVDATIFEIQQGVHAPDTMVTVTGAVVTSGLDSDGELFWIADPMGGAESGIAVFVDGLAVTVAPGDEVTITGEYREFYELSEIALLNAGDLTVTGTATQPAPSVVAPADVATGSPDAEQWEGVIITVENVTVSDVDAMFGEFGVDGGLRIDDLFFTAGTWADPMVDDTYASITGPLTYSFDEFKLVPRSAADLVP